MDRVTYGLGQDTKETGAGERWEETDFVVFLRRSAASTLVGRKKESGSARWIQRD